MNWIFSSRLPSETSLGKVEPGFVVSWKKVSNASKAKQFVNKTALLPRNRSIELVVCYLHRQVVCYLHLVDAILAILCNEIILGRWSVRMA